MKYKQKYLDNLYKDSISNFKDIIDISIYFFDEIEELDYGYEAVHSIEKLGSLKVVQLLIQDFPYRKNNDFSCYGYQTIWWALLNSYNNDVYHFIKENMTPELKKVFNYWLIHDLEPNIDTYDNLKRFV